MGLTTVQRDCAASPVISQLIVQNFRQFAFRATLGGLRDKVPCSSWKARSQLLISVNNDFFAIGVTAESVYEQKEIENRRFRSNSVSLIQNIRYKGSPPPIIFDG